MKKQPEVGENLNNAIKIIRNSSPYRCKSAFQEFINAAETLIRAAQRPAVEEVTADALINVFTLSQRSGQDLQRILNAFPHGLRIVKENT